MDSFTQIVLGASVGEAILGKKIGRRATLWGAISGTIPDLDVFALKFFPYVEALSLHRGFTHSILFALLSAIFLALILNAFYKKNLKTNFMDWFLLFFWGLFTHALLDCHTTWGTQLFWPLDHRLALSSIFVIDPLYTLPFAALLVTALFYKKNNIKRRRLNYIGLGISSLYLLCTFLTKQIVTEKFEIHLKENQIAYTDINVRPTPLNSFLWSANIQTEKAYLIGNYSIFDTEFKPNFINYPKKHFLLNKHTGNEELQKLLSIMKGDFIVQHKGTNLLISDLRFGQLYFGKGNGPFVFNSLLEIENNKIKAIREANSVRDKQEITKSLDELWKRIKGN